MSIGERVCAACGASTAGSACTSCGASVVRVLPELLAGAVPASTRARLVATGLDLGGPAAVLGVALFVGPAMRGLLIALAALWLVGVWSARGRVGLTPGNLAFGLRTVDASSGLPLGLRDVPLAPGSRAVVLDVRTGRDPTRTVAAGVQAALAAVPRAHASATAERPTPSAAQAPATPAPTPEVAEGVPGPGATGTLVLVLDDGQRVPVDGIVLLGRNPVPRPDEHVDRLVPLHDLGRTLSKTHARARREGATVWLADRGSTNGTAVTDRAGRTARVTDLEVAVPIGARIHLGDRSLVLRHEADDRTALRPTRSAVTTGGPA